ncbi:MAG TPA: translation initiation factor IF-3 [Bacteroidia bacterium]|nr:translation initiation factor IF-3 [Bacteroidia bacterium]HNT80616.1 translation initiation factor IF-3 [Bacteroidia bacterium]
MRKQEYRPRTFGGARRKEAEHRINQYIRVPQVRVVGPNIDNDIYDTAKALEVAKELGLDLVEISPESKPPVCKILDYQKFLYERKRKEKEIKAKSAKSVMKEIRFGPNTDEHDFNFKVKHAIKFLEEGAKVKAYVHFKGRSIVYKEQGEIILLRFAEALEEFGKVEAMPKLEGKRMFLFLAPVSTKK